MALKRRRSTYKENCVQWWSKESCLQMFARQRKLVGSKAYTLVWFLGENNSKTFMNRSHRKCYILWLFTLRVQNKQFEIYFLLAIVLSDNSDREKTLVDYYRRLLDFPWQKIDIVHIFDKETNKFHWSWSPLLSHLKLLPKSIDLRTHSTGDTGNGERVDARCNV